MNLEIIKARPLIARTNYGDDSIAMIQWAYEAGLANLTVVYIETGWQAASWEKRVQQGEAHARSCGYKTLRLLSKISFREAVLERGSFPSHQFQWCAGWLKGLPFLDWLDTEDIKCRSIVMIAKRGIASEQVPQFIENCEYHNDRTVWHPLWDVDENARDALLHRAGFTPLRHRSLECEPCVNSCRADLTRLSKQDKNKLLKLEKQLGKKMFTEMPELETGMDLFYKGCGNRFGCGF